MVKKASAPLLKQILSVARRYRDTLRSHVVPPHEVVNTAAFPQEEEDRAVWIETKSLIRPTMKLMEGVEVFALLAYVDWELWKQEAETIWPKSRWDEWTSAPTLIGIDVNLAIPGQCVETVLAWLAKSSHVYSQSKQLQEARVLMHKMLASCGRTVPHVPVRLSCSDITQESCQILSLVLTQARFAGLDMMTKMVLDGGQFYNGLRVEYLRVVHDFPVVDAPSLQFLAVIADEGVDIEDLGIFEKSTMKAEVFPHQVTAALWKLLAIGEKDDSICGRRAKHLTVSPLYPAPVLSCIFSAIRASRSIRAITINLNKNDAMSVDERQTMWSWIAFALFSTTVGSPNRLESVTLDAEGFTSADKERVRAVLGANDPLALLVDRSSALASESVSASRFSLVDPKSKAKSASEPTRIESRNVLEDLPVLERSSTWTKVLVPAVGEAWIHGDDIHASTRSQRGPFGIKSITEVTIDNVADPSKHAVMELLRTIGGGVRSLSINGFPASFNREGPSLGFDGWCDSIFDACPHLESLSIEKGTMNSLQFLLDGYASGVCRLTTFSVHGRPSSIDSALFVDTFHQLLVALSDPQHPAARYLTEFEFRWLAVEDLLRPEMESALVTMLERNKRVRVFDLTVHFNASTSQRQRCTELVKPFDGEPISSARAPVSIRQRLAFLSAIHPRKATKARSRRQARAIEQLDADVVSLIFTMAAECVKRRVRISW